MKMVGLRDLKNRLSEYVRHVRAGHTVIVTDRGQAVVELRPPELVPAGTRIDRAVGVLVNRGLLTPGAPNAARLYPRLSRLLRSTTSKELLQAERGAR